MGVCAEVLHCAAFLYADDCLIAFTDPVWLQGAFDTMTGLLERYGFWTNIVKKFSMLCYPCCAVGTQEEACYERRMNG